MTARVTRGAPVWGREAALKRFKSLYPGTWKLSPDMANLKTAVLSETAAQLDVPITFNIGAAGQPAPDTPFLMNKTLVKTPAGWHRQHLADTGPRSRRSVPEVTHLAHRKRWSGAHREFFYHRHHRAGTGHGETSASGCFQEPCRTRSLPF